MYMFALWNEKSFDKVRPVGDQGLKFIGGRNLNKNLYLHIFEFIFVSIQRCIYICIYKKIKG